MMGLSQTSVYAVRALSSMPTGTNHTCLIRDLAGSTRIPKPYLAKIVNKLNHCGLVYAKRGYLGGIALSRPPEKISILEVVEAVEGKNWISRCLLETDCCEAPRNCPTGKRWTKVREEVKDILRDTTLAEATAFARLKAGALRATRGSRRRPRGRRAAGAS